MPAARRVPRLQHAVLVDGAELGLVRGQVQAHDVGVVAAATGVRAPADAGERHRDRQQDEQRERGARAGEPIRLLGVVAREGPEQHPREDDTEPGEQHHEDHHEQDPGAVARPVRPLSRSEQVVAEPETPKGSRERQQLPDPVGEAPAASAAEEEHEPHGEHQVGEKDEHLPAQPRRAARRRRPRGHGFEAACR